MIGAPGLNDARAADPIGDFFKRLGRSLSKNGKHQPARRTTSQKNGKPADQDTNPGAEGSPVGPSPSATGKYSPAVRAATSIPDSKNSKRDAPFGIPVPGKKGFVTSPFSPDGNYVDVHAFPPGTEVKDPYTGRIFRVP